MLLSWLHSRPGCETPKALHDDKARLHERLPELARAISERSGTSNIRLDSFIVSATSYEDLHESYDDGSWDRERFAASTSCFRSVSGEYDYVAEIVEGACAVAGRSSRRVRLACRSTS